MPSPPHSFPGFSPSSSKRLAWLTFHAWPSEMNNPDAKSFKVLKKIQNEKIFRNDLQRTDPLRINCLQNMAGQLLRRVFSDQQISESKGRMNANERLLENDTEVLLSYLIFHRCRRSNIGEKPHQQKRNGKWFYHTLLVKLADSLEIAFIRLILQYFFSSIARLLQIFFFENAISAIRVLCAIRALHRLQSWTK